MAHYCYILTNACNQTYNGYTNNLRRRIRQHNSEIQGGARYTCGKGPWTYLAIITCIASEANGANESNESEGNAFDMRRALSLEWSIKYPTNKRPRPKAFNGAHGRLASLVHVFGNPKFADLTFTVYVHEAFLGSVANARPLSELAEL